MTTEAFGAIEQKPADIPRARPFVALGAILHREALRFLGQRGRLVAALVRPLVWLFVFASGFRAALGLSITPPYQTYITYEIYIVPGLVGMILLFSGMQSSLSLVYDREMGSMRLLLTAPLPRCWTQKRPISTATVSGVMAGTNSGVATLMPSTALSTEIAGVIMLSP